MEENQEIINPKFPRNKKLKYLSPDTIFLDFPFILSKNKKLKIGYPYLKIENWLADSHIQAVRLLDVWDNGNTVFLKIQDLQTSQTNTIASNLNYDDDFWLWSLADFDYLLDLAKK